MGKQFFLNGRTSVFSHCLDVFRVLLGYTTCTLATLQTFYSKYKGKAIPKQASTGSYSPGGSSQLVIEGGRVVSPIPPPLPLGDTPGTHFCYRLSLPQGNSAAERIKSMNPSGIDARPSGF
jgi:hypothetical protein